jgi:tetratricopeptide (TPR) repeat protein
MFYSRADEALEKSLRLTPDSCDALKVRAWILLGKHEFAKALEVAQNLQKRNPDDVVVYGYLVDANAELGIYKDAEQAAQWMLDLRPGNVPGLTRAAYLRELFGDVDGALELMSMVFDSTAPSETEDRAWLLTQMAHLHLLEGRVNEAERLLTRALHVFPQYHYALANLAKVRLLQHRYSEAVELLRQRFANAPHAENLFDLAEALKLAGQTTKAKQAFALFEIKSLAESERADNSNRELIFYYADHAHRPGDALRIAKREFARRHDVYTIDSYAWALYANRSYAKARQQIEAALEIGIRDPKLLEHSRRIIKATATP